MKGVLRWGEVVVLKIVGEAGSARVSESRELLAGFSHRVQIRPPKYTEAKEKLISYSNFILLPPKIK